MSRRIRGAPRCVEPFIGIPYQDNGRTRDGADCWGLLRMFYDEILGIELPAYSGALDPADAERIEVRSLFDAEISSAWIPVEPGRERFGDALEILVLHSTHHCGVVVSAEEKLLLHSSFGLGSVIHPYRRGLACSTKMTGLRVQGIFRHSSLA